MKIGFVSMPYVGHLNPMMALGRKLQSRGHEVVFIGVPDVEPFAQAAGLDFVPYCEKEYPAGSIAKVFQPVSKLRGMEIVRRTCLETQGDFFLAASKNLPQKLAAHGVEALVLDAIHTFLELVPMSLDMPYVHVWNAFHFDFSGTTPPCLFDWPHEIGDEARARNVRGLQEIGEIFAPLMPLAMSYAESVGLKVDWNNPAATASKIGTITQVPKEFDFPDIPWPDTFHYAGPFVDNEARESITFPWDKLTDAPLIYASLGTLVNGLEIIYKIILQAAERLPHFQVVLSTGTNIKLEDLGPIPENVVAVAKAPQIDLLKRAKLCITHAGLNTTLEALGLGVPMVAIPIGYDQPGIASRIAYHGVGEFANLDELTTDRLQNLIQRVLMSTRYREKAQHFQQIIAKARGLDIAADVIEQAFGESLAEKKPLAALLQQF